MRKELIPFCPACREKLVATKLSCLSCGLEMSDEFDLPAISRLNKEDKEILELFLICGGKIKDMQQKMGKSYQTTKKMLDNVFENLGYKPIEGGEEQMEVDVSKFHVEDGGTKPSDIIRKKFIDNGGIVKVSALEGNIYTIYITADGNNFETVALPAHTYNFSVFDTICDLLQRKGGSAEKGNGRSYRLGEGKCTKDTVVGAIAIDYAGQRHGESVFDPVFIMAAILDWAGICHNRRGYIEFTQQYKSGLL